MGWSQVGLAGNSRDIRENGGGMRVGRGVFAFGEAAFDPVLEAVKCRVGHVVQMRAGFGKTADGHFDPGQMDINALTLVVVVGDFERVVHATSASLVRSGRMP